MAQAPVPQARVSPTPRSQTPGPNVASIDYVNYFEVDASGEEWGDSRVGGPTSERGNSSTGMSVKWTAWGLPIDTQVTGTVRSPSSTG